MPPGVHFDNLKDSRYLGLTMPRVLARLPYGCEDLSGGRVCLRRRYRERGSHEIHVDKCGIFDGHKHHTLIQALWLVRAIRGAESGGMVEGLPVHSFPTDDGGVRYEVPDPKSALPTGAKPNWPVAAWMPISHWKNTDYAVFVGAQSLQKAPGIRRSGRQPRMRIWLPGCHIFSTQCRFAHFLKCIVRDKVGGFASRESLQSWLNKWIRPLCGQQPEVD